MVPVESSWLSAIRFPWSTCFKRTCCIINQCFQKVYISKYRNYGNFFHILSSKKHFGRIVSSRLRFPGTCSVWFSPFFRFFLISPFTFRTIHDTVIASEALTALKIKQTCRVDVCASSARQTGSCWQDEGNFPRCTYRIPLHQKIAPYIISCCGLRICKGGIFLCKKARTTSFPGSLNHPVNSRRSPLSLPAPCSARCPLYLDTTPLKSHQT